MKKNIFAVMFCLTMLSLMTGVTVAQAASTNNKTAPTTATKTPQVKKPLAKVKYRKVVVKPKAKVLGTKITKAPAPVL